MLWSNKTYHSLQDPMLTLHIFPQKTTRNQKVANEVTSVGQTCWAKFSPTHPPESPRGKTGGLWEGVVFPQRTPRNRGCPFLSLPEPRTLQLTGVRPHQPSSTMTCAIRFSRHSRMPTRTTMVICHLQWTSKLLNIHSSTSPRPFQRW